MPSVLGERATKYLDRVVATLNPLQNNFAHLYLLSFTIDLARQNILRGVGDSRVPSVDVGSHGFPTLGYLREHVSEALRIYKEHLKYRAELGTTLLTQLLGVNTSTPVENTNLSGTKQSSQDRDLLTILRQDQLVTLENMVLSKKPLEDFFIEDEAAFKSMLVALHYASAFQVVKKNIGAGHSLEFTSTRGRTADEEIITGIPDKIGMVFVDGQTFRDRHVTENVPRVVWPAMIILADLGPQGNKFRFISEGVSVTSNGYPARKEGSLGTAYDLFPRGDMRLSSAVRVKSDYKDPVPNAWIGSQELHLFYNLASALQDLPQSILDLYFNLDLNAIPAESRLSMLEKLKEIRRFQTLVHDLREKTQDQKMIAGLSDISTLYDQLLFQKVNILTGIQDKKVLQMIETYLNNVLRDILGVTEAAIETSKTVDSAAPVAESV